jgi:NADPH:quinone reductase-like Zn-dependent oxidoreductase
LKAVIAREYGPVAEVVQFQDVPEPEVGEFDVLVEIHAASVNPVDHLTVKGHMRAFLPLAPPFTLGNDLAGVVSAVGGRVTRFAVGEEVFARVAGNRPGTFAEFAAVEETLVAHAPKAVSAAGAASLPLVVLTAWQALVERGGIAAGQSVLVHAGSGGVGSAAIQLASYLGARVAATTGPDGMDLARDLGAERVVDYRSGRFEDLGSDFDIVLDTVGGQTQARSLDVLRPGGTLVSVVGAAGVQEAAAGRGVAVESFLMRPDGDQLELLAGLVDAGVLRPVIDRRFPLEHGRQALLYSEAGRAKGKVVIDVR